MITRTIVATCDNAEPCPATIDIPATTTQEWRYIIERGWTLVNEEEAILTMCPAHGDAPAKP